MFDNKVYSSCRFLKYICGIFLFYGHFAFSQINTTTVDTLNSYPLDEVIISATRNEKNMSEVGRSVTVITEEDIKSSIYNSPAELLSKQEGIYVIGTGQNPGSNSSIFMRSSNSNHTVIMIDGVRISDPSTPNDAIDLAELSLANIEKIEIVRGSHSTMYGTSAIGGVINIITKKGSKPGFNTQAGLKTGVFGKKTLDLTETLYLNYSSKSGFYGSAEVFNSFVKGLNATIDTIKTPGKFKNIDNDDFSKTDLIGKLGYEKGKLDAFVSYKITQQKADVDRAPYADDDNYTVEFDRDLISYQAKYAAIKKLDISFNGGYSNMTRIAVNDSSVVDEIGNTDHSYFKGVYSGTILNNEMQATLRLKGANIVAGTGMYSETMKTNTTFINSAYSYYQNVNLDTLGLRATITNTFLQLDLNGSLLYKNLNRLSLILGSRLNNHNLYGYNITFEINPSYKLSDNTLLYVAYSTGFNAPSLYNLYFPKKNITSGISTGNKSLKPETSVSFEMGLKQTINDNFKIGMSCYNTITSNSIDYVYLWDKNVPISSLKSNNYLGETYLNIGKQTVIGIEFSLYSKISKKLAFSGNFSLTGGKLKYSPSDIDNEKTEGNHVQLYTTGAFLSKTVEYVKLVRRPVTANVHLGYNPTRNLTLSLDIRYAGTRNDIAYNQNLGAFGALELVPVSDYTLTDITAKYLITKNLTATLRAENIFGVVYSEINGYRTRGRGAYLNINYSISYLTRK